MGKGAGHAVKVTNTYEKHTFPSYIHEFTNAPDFIEKKMEMLQEDFMIKLSTDDIAYLKSLKTEREINAAVRTIIDRSWR